MRFVAFVYLILSCLASPVSVAQAPAGSTDRDPYGGWNNLRFESTGFFHVSERDGVWWLVTPQGNAFLSKGVNNVSFRADDAPSLVTRRTSARCRASTVRRRLGPKPSSIGFAAGGSIRSGPGPARAPSAITCRTRSTWVSPRVPARTGSRERSAISSPRTSRRRWKPRAGNFADPTPRILGFSAISPTMSCAGEPIGEGN